MSVVPIRELEWFPKPCKIRELAGAEKNATSEDAETRAAWDAATQFCSRYVGNDVHGNFGPEHGWYPKTFPKLSQRILDTVRRTGGWRTYKCMTDEDYPHQRKRFFEEYACWMAIEQIAPAKLHDNAGVAAHDAADGHAEKRTEAGADC